MEKGSSFRSRIEFRISSVIPAKAGIHVHRNEFRFFSVIPAKAGIHVHRNEASESRSGNDD
jgi:hypothetical protein